MKASGKDPVQCSVASVPRLWPEGPPAGRQRDLAEPEAAVSRDGCSTADFR